MTTALLLALSLSTAYAQDPEAVDWVDVAEVEEVEEPQTDLSIELGGSYTTGNSVAWTAYGLVGFGHRWQMNKLGAEAKGTLGASIPDTDGNGRIGADERDAGLKTNARRVRGKVRYDRFFSDKDSLYFLAGGFHDPFAGFTWRLHEQVGYSRILAGGKRVIGEGDDAVELVTELKAELGVDYAQEQYTPEVDPRFSQFVAARAFVGFKHQFTEATSITEEIEVYENLFTPADLRLYNTIAFSTKITSILSLKLSHDLVFYNRPPIPELKKVDQTVLFTLVASLL